MSNYLDEEDRPELQWLEDALDGILGGVKLLGLAFVKLFWALACALFPSLKD